MNTRNIRYFGCGLLLGCMIATCGCTTHHGAFTVASTKLIRLNEFELDKAGRVRGVEGRDVAHIIILVPTKESSLKTAMDNALDGANADVMTDVSIEAWFFYIPYIYGQQGWKVKGDAIKTRLN